MGVAHAKRKRYKTPIRACTNERALTLLLDECAIMYVKLKYGILPQFKIMCHSE